MPNKKFPSEEEFMNLGLEEAKRVLLEMIEELPDEACKELYEKLESMGLAKQQ